MTVTAAEVEAALAALPHIDIRKGDMLDALEAAEKVRTEGSTETPPLPNHCQECGVWGSVEAHLRTCSHYQRDGYAEHPQREALIAALQETPLIAGYDWLGTGSVYPSDEDIHREIGEVADAVLPFLPQGVYQYRAQHPRYTEGLKDDFQWTRLLGVVQEIAQEWGPDAWIERRFVGPIERVQDSETPADAAQRDAYAGTPMNAAQRARLMRAHYPIRDGLGKPLTKNSHGEWVNEVGDTPCPNDGEMTNVKCWKCGWVRADHRVPYAQIRAEEQERGLR